MVDFVVCLPQNDFVNGRRTSSDMRPCQFLNLGPLFYLHNNQFSWQHFQIPNYYLGKCLNIDSCCYCVVDVDMAGTFRMCSALASDGVVFWFADHETRGIDGWSAQAVFGALPTSKTVPLERAPFCLAATKYITALVYITVFLQMISFMEIFQWQSLVNQMNKFTSLCQRTNIWDALLWKQKDSIPAFRFFCFYL